MRDAVEWSLKAILCLAQDGATAEGPDVPLPTLKAVCRDFAANGAAETAARFRALTASPAPLDDGIAGELLKSGAELVETAQKALARAALA